MEEEVKRGQLQRGNSPWGSPPFPTKEFPNHKRQRKRRMVIDYRRVNARIRRAVYFVRNAPDVTMECAGSVWMMMVDACAGFNPTANTERAHRLLAIISRSRKFLPGCSTFGSTNGPEDVCYVIDRVHSPGRYGKKNVLQRMERIC